MGFATAVYAWPLRRTTGDGLSGIALFLSDQRRDRRLSRGLCPRAPAPCANQCKSRQNLQDRGTIRGDLWRAHAVAENVVVATGAYNNPKVPPFARELDENIVQLHSKEYRNPAQIQKGGVLVVGAGNSGADHSSPPDMAIRPGHGQEPTRAGSLPDHLFTPIMWFMATQVLTVKNPLGRKVRDYFLDPPHGIPLGRVRRKDFAVAGIERVPRMTGVSNRYPVLEDGRVLRVSNVIWCTGFTPSYEWLDLSLPAHNGVPIHNRGIVECCPGLYLVGLPFLHSLSSVLVGGVGRDAEHIVHHIDSTRSARREQVRGRTAAGAKFTR